MKKHVRFFCTALLTVIIATSCSKKSEETTNNTEPEAATKQSETTNDLPRMPMTFVDGSTAEVRSLSGSLILVLFQPDCDHCQREAQAIKDNIGAFDNYTVYFVSSAPAPELVAFSKTYGLNDKDNFRFATTDVQNILNNFGAIDAPSVYIYNGSGKLTSKFNGETDIHLILESI